MEYSLAKTKMVQRWSWSKKLPWCNNVQLNNVQLLIRDVVWQTSKCYSVTQCQRSWDSEIKSSNCPQEHVKSLLTMMSKSITFLDFRLYSVAIYCSWDDMFCSLYIDNFCTNQLVKEFWKSVHVCQSYLQT